MARKAAANVITGTFAMTVATLAVVVGVLSASAQVCNIPSRMQFKPNTDARGAASYVSRENLPMTFTAEVPLLPIILQFIVTDAMTGEETFDFTLDGVTVTASLEPSLRIGGNSIEVNRGEAIFDALTIQELPSTAPGATAPQLVFTLVAPNGATKTLRTGDVRAVAADQQGTPAAVQFGAAGFFTRAGMSRDIPVAPAAIPKFSLDVVNPIGGRYGRTVEVVVTATGARVSPTTFNGVDFVISNLQVIPDSPTARPVLTFTAQQSTGFSATVSTGPLTPVSESARNRFLLFDETASKYVSLENIGTTAVLGVPLAPVVIQLRSSDMQVDTSNTGLIITAATPQGTLRGAEAVVTRGVATFSDLTFVGTPPRSAVITFTAGTQGSLPVAGATLLSGAVAVSVTAVKAQHLSFAIDSDVREDTRAYFEQVNSEFSVSRIVVQMRDSAHRIDSSASDINLELSATRSATSAKDQTKMSATVQNGIAVFSGLIFTLPSSEFQFEVIDPTAKRASLFSGFVTVAQNPLTADARRIEERAREHVQACHSATGTVSCLYTLAFAEEFGTFSSHVFEADQPVFTTVGTPIPTIVVELRDQFGVASAFPDSIAPALVAYTGVDPDAETQLVTEGNANHGSWQNGRYSFSCLQFRTVPDALVRIKFMPVDMSTTPPTRLDGITRGSVLQTGFASVTSVAVPSYGIRFAPDASLIAYPGQRSSAVLNIALPPIAIDIVDSLGRFDATESSAVIVATASSGDLDPIGSRGQVTEGRAVFTGLKFASVADEPFITFKVYQTANAVAGKTISTGAFTVTTLPISDFTSAFLPEESADNMVPYAFKPLIFQSSAEATVKVSVTITDSAHQRTGALSSTIFLTPSSDQARFDAAELKTIDPRTACVCANFSNRIVGYRDGVAPGTPIYIRYTVTDATGLLLGRTVVAGPITVTELAQQAGASGAACAATAVAPSVVAEFRMSTGDFRNRNMQAELAFLLGIEASRVSIGATSIVPITRVDHETLATWQGTKALLSFGDPLATSTNRRTSAELAADFVALRPLCDARSLNLASAYYLSDDQSCDLDAFRAALAASRQCEAQGIVGQCQCYDQGVIAKWGQACAEEAALQSDFQTLCTDLTDCAEAAIQDVCDSILAADETSFLWLWITLGSLAGVVLIVIVLKQRGLLHFRTKASLRSENDAKR